MWYTLVPLGEYDGPCNSFHCFGHSKNVYDDDGMICAAAVITVRVTAA